MVEEDGVVLLDDPVKQRVFGLVALIADDR
jgi:hypothetical protein